MLLNKKMKIHCDWNDPNSSMAVTFDDEEGEATESFQDFSTFLKRNNLRFTTFKLKGAPAPSMVVNLPTVTSQNNSSENCNSETSSTNKNQSHTDDSHTEEENNDETNTSDNTSSDVPKKKKKKVNNV